MGRLPKPRQGIQLRVKSRPLPFSYWPVYKGTRRFGLQSTLFALDPWNIISMSIDQRCKRQSRREAHAYVEQARDFYNASVSAQITAARPLLLYYCFMNLAKAYVLTKGAHSTLVKAQHGLWERPQPNASLDLKKAVLRAYKSPNVRGETQIYDIFYNAISGNALAADFDFQLSLVLPQILAGHRLWAQAASRTERFIAVHQIRLMENVNDKKIWTNLFFFSDDLSRLSLTRKEFIAGTCLANAFREVRCADSEDSRPLLCLEQIAPLSYSDRPTDVAADLVETMKPYLWSTVASIPPYRRYYAYCCPGTERRQTVPQLLSIFLIFYYLGSITRYRPHLFDKLLAGKFGPRIEEFVHGQPLQYIYLLASEFAQQEVVRPSIV
jgi:hypothetical protein